jgi:NDP-sugar pyrophosphorylase family protein
MTKLLICPSERNSMRFLAQRAPLANVPLLGQSLLEYWLSSLAIRGTKKAIILAHDRPEIASEVAGAGERWGLEAKVLAESRELTIAEAVLKYSEELQKPVPAADDMIVLDHLPGLPEQALFTDYQSWFRTLRDWMPCALTPDRVGMNETLPGIWKGCHARVSPEAQLHAPCWIGQHVFVGARAVIGPGAILEDGCFVESGAELTESWVGPDTFVGQFAQIRCSLAWGNTLLNWQTGSETQVADPFLLCAVRNPHRRASGRFKKLSALYERNKNEVGLMWKHLLLHKEG